MMGKVLELIDGYDGKIRTVKLKQGNRSIQGHFICNLYPLELSVSHPIRGTGNRGAEANSNSKQESGQSVRPKRKATERFQRMLMENLDDL